MKKNYLINGFVYAIICFALYSCEYETVQPMDLQQTDPVSFSEQIAPIFENASCTSCHSGAVSPDLTIGNSYNSISSGNLVDVDNPSESIIVMKINEGHGTANDVSPPDRALILQWIEEGALDN
ncbi:MAG: hypothetical protein HN704_04475 [Bacteroidetes bacterium]|jgi:hypothetical protein|nr:hypothetical protein [Bacteroidota bacterium]MBT6685967.1 hypothetical protein [Bacteroidota bacterium]MBT7144433.1 hypothetical protein [Bacteroidota bacterium]MBT7490848.1 hypothetical protein [Bacteroidota bacterium]